MSNPLVSIVTPSFNGGVYLPNYFERLLEQTYDNIEVVLVNNGSTDNTEEIVNKYRPELLRKKILFKYYKIEKNTGPLKGLNLGIQNLTGDYFSEIDVDDSIHKDYIEKKIEFFVNNPSVDILINPVDVFKITDKSNAINRVWSKKFHTKEELINRYLLSDDVGYMGGAYMMKSSTFFATYKNHQIIDSDQIWGFATILYFPQIYLYNAAYMDCVLYDYYIHGNNLHITSEKNNLYVLPTTYELVMKAMGIDDEEKKNILRKVSIYVSRELLGIAFKERDRVTFDIQMEKLMALSGIRLKDRIKRIILNNELFFKLYSLCFLNK